MSTFHSTPISCGVIECHDLPYVGLQYGTQEYCDNNWNKFLKEFYTYCKVKRGYSGLFRTLVWSTNPGTNADALCAYMEKNGEVVKTKPCYNHTHNTTIQTFIWTPSDECEKVVLELVGATKDPEADARSVKYWSEMKGGTRDSHVEYMEKEYQKYHSSEFLRTRGSDFDPWCVFGSSG